MCPDLIERAWSRSATRSSAASIPTDNRTRLGGVANGASAVEACVIWAGVSIRLSTPPRLSASDQMLRPRHAVDAPAARPSTQERDHAAEVAHLAGGDLVARMRGEAGLEHALDGRRVRRGTRRSPRAFAQCWRIRTRQRLQPAQHQPGVERPGHGAQRVLQEAPAARRSRRRSSPRSRRPGRSGRPGTWSSSGRRCRRRARAAAGGTARRRCCRRRRARRPRAPRRRRRAMSTTFRSGLVGDSSQTHPRALVEVRGEAGVALLGGHVGEVVALRLVDLREQPVGAAVDVVHRRPPGRRVETGA